MRDRPGDGGFAAAPPEARAALIHRVAPLRPVPGLAGPVHLAPEPLPVWEAVEALEGLRWDPPFWAHLWPGSWALALEVAQGPRLDGVRVLDFACGGGVAGAAAAARGAQVLASDLDPYAISCARLNAQAWGVTCEVTTDDVIGRDGGWALVLVGDVFYERTLAEHVSAWLDALTRRGARAWVGDPGRQFFPQARARLTKTFALAANPAWDSVLDRPARVWEWTGR